MKRTQKLAALVSASFLALGLAVGPAAQARPYAEPDQMGEQIDQKIDRRVKERIAPALGLDEATARKFADVLKQDAQRRFEAMKNVRAERQTLRALVDRGASDAELTAQLHRIDAAKSAVPDRTATRERLRSLLTPQQQAKLELMGPGQRGMGQGQGQNRGMGPGMGPGNCPANCPGMGSEPGGQ